MLSKRELWVDNVKVIACFFVLLGHLMQSMASINDIPSVGFYPWFNTTIYYFHVPLFFICSGYLYQKFSKVETISQWYKNAFKKLITLGIPYVTFEICVWIIKTVFGGVGRNEVGGLFTLLFLQPTSPYWYLYCLFFIFVITPTFKNKRMAIIGLTASLIMKILSVFDMGGYAIDVVLGNEIWFVLGMLIAIYHLNMKRINIWKFLCLGIVFISASFFTSNFESPLLSFVMGLLACVSIIGGFIELDRDFIQLRILTFLSKYTMPIFLMHSIFAATLRSVFLKLGVTSALIHIPLGIIVSMIGPIIIAKFMKKTKYLEILLYPSRFIHMN